MKAPGCQHLTHGCDPLTCAPEDLGRAWPPGTLGSCPVNERTENSSSCSITPSSLPPGTPPSPSSNTGCRHHGCFPLCLPLLSAASRPRHPPRSPGLPSLAGSVGLGAHATHFRTSSWSDWQWVGADWVRFAHRPSGTAPQRLPGGLRATALQTSFDEAAARTCPFQRGPVGTRGVPQQNRSHSLRVRTYQPRPRDPGVWGTPAHGLSPPALRAQLSAPSPGPQLSSHRRTEGTSRRFNSVCHALLPHARLGCPLHARAQWLRASASPSAKRVTAARAGHHPSKECS